MLTTTEVRKAKPKLYFLCKVVYLFPASSCKYGHKTVIKAVIFRHTDMCSNEYFKYQITLKAKHFLNIVEMTFLCSFCYLTSEIS